MSSKENRSGDSHSEDPGKKTIGGFLTTQVLGTSDVTEFYRAKGENNKGEVLLKTTQKKLAKSLEREFEILKNNKLNGVLRPIKLIDDDSRSTFVFEDRPGILLSSYSLTHRSGMTWFLSFASSAARCLSVLRKAGWVHGDLRPHHMLYDEKTAELTLLGFARSKTPDGPSLKYADPSHDALLYTSPEQTGRTVGVIDHRSDLYSLGIVFYEILCGKSPFEQYDDPLALAHSHIARRPEPLQNLRDDIPLVIEQIVLKLIEKTPEDRYQTAEGLLADIEQCKHLFDGQDIADFQLGEKDFSSHLVVPNRLFARRDEQKHLEESLEKCISGSTVFLEVTGPSGSGKSSLVWELREKITSKSGHFIWGKFERLHKNVPYLALTKSLSRFVHQILSEPAESIGVWREDIVGALGKTASVITDIIPDLSAIIGSPSKAPTLPPAEAKNRLHHVFRQLVQAISPKHSPLVWVLDDLQWIDSASVELLAALLKECPTTHLMIVGIYRDNEVSEDHSLRLLLDDDSLSVIEDKTHLHLDSFDLKTTKKWLSNCLECEQPQVEQLASVFQKRTGGNPLFLRSLLLSIHEQNLITRDHKTGQWLWNIEAIEAIPSGDDVAEHIADHLKRLPKSTQDVIAQASCFGSTFDLFTLSNVLDDELSENIEAHLALAIEHGLLRVLRDSYPPVDGVTNEEKKSFRFTHNRVEQAAQSFLSEEKKQLTHLNIARSRFRDLSEDGSDSDRFSTTDHYNIGRDLVKSQEEKDRLAKLNLSSGNRALSSSAHNAAFNYYEIGIDLLGPDKWERQELLCRELFLGSAESSQQRADWDHSEERIREGLVHTDDLVEKTKFHILEIQMATLSDEREKAIDLACEILVEFGVRIPRNPGIPHILIEVLRTQRALKKRKNRNILDLPLLTDPKVSCAIELMSMTGPAAYLSTPNLLGIVAMKMIQLSLVYGLAPPTPQALMSYALILVAGLGFYKEGSKIAKLAVDLDAQIETGVYSSKTELIYRSVVAHWSQPLVGSLDGLAKTHRLALEVGDHLYAAYSHVGYVYYAFSHGVSLDEMAESMDERIEETRSHQAWIGLRSINFFQRLLGLFHEPSLWRQGQELIDELEPEVPRGVPEWRSTWFDYTYCILLFSYHFGQPDEAFAIGKYAVSPAHTVVGSHSVVVLHYFDALNCLKYARNNSGTKRRKALNRAKKSLSKIRKWAKHCPENNLHRLRLLEAELAYTSGDLVKPGQLYEEAAKLAEKENFIHDQALSLELASEFFQANHIDSAAEAYMKKAVDVYKTWGAHGKVEYLETLHPDWFQSAPPSLRQPKISQTSWQPDEGKFDLESIVKASQTISGEILLEKLTRKVMGIVLENAGARRGCLVISRDEQLYVVAPQSVEFGASSELETPLDKFPDIARSVVSFVLHSQEDVVLGDTQVDSRFARDPWLLQSRVRSLLCIPIVKSSDVLGALYLENDLTQDAFVPERVELLRILSGQIAISLENAILYRDLQQLNLTLEEKVEERTEQLRQAQQELLEKAHKAGMADVATQVLHNIGNLLNSVCVSATLIRDSVRKSELKRVDKVEDLLGPHLDQLENFVSEDQRAPSVLKYYLNLGQALKREQEKQEEEADRLVQGLDSITEAVAAQQKYAEAPKFEESVELSTVIDEALKLCSASFAAHNIQVVRKEESLKPVKVHQSKLVQVLVELIENAKDAMENEDDRTLTISTSQGVRDAELSIEDSGQGIDKNKLEEIFKYGFSTKRNARGAGLHRSANQVGEMGGKLKAKSDGKGLGCKMIISFPVMEPKLATTTKSGQRDSN